MTPLEDNYRVYKVIDGRRSQLGSADLKAESGKWHTLRVVQHGDHIQCYFNGELLLDVKDNTFKSPGKIGLWIKADAQTEFANLTVTLFSQENGSCPCCVPLGIKFLDQEILG